MALTVVGGTYLELCYDPHWYELYGSGLRGAAAISGYVSDIKFVSSVGEDDISDAEAICSTFGICPAFTPASKTTSFSYYHPLSIPSTSYQDQFGKIVMPNVVGENILLYGMIEAEVKVDGDYVVYDPQNWISFEDTNSTARHLALVLNKKEAYLISNLSKQTSLLDVGKHLLISENAEVVVIKNGAQGAMVVEKSRHAIIPVFRTNAVWPIGSGDVFSAAFAWKWAIEKTSATEAANLASRLTAQYCQNRVLPLVNKNDTFETLITGESKKNIYIAGPFFTISEKWLINEIRNVLTDFGNVVFSPLHDVGIGHTDEIVAKDLAAIVKCDVMLAVFSGIDPGTIFEIGYAVALSKRVVVLAENILSEDLTMLVGTGCEITNDFSTAIYWTSW